jgi:hypothetical protein
MVRISEWEICQSENLPSFSAPIASLHRDGLCPFFLGALLPLVHLQNQYQLTIRSYIMNKIEPIEKLRNTIRRKHFSLSTERTYIGWLVRFMRYLADGHAQRLYRGQPRSISHPTAT